jgi:chromosome segregation ATPase
MPPFELLQPDAHKPTPSPHSASDDAAANIHHQQARMQLENRLRVKKLEVNDRNHKAAAVEREIAHLEVEIAHDDGDIKRVEGELHQVESVARKEEGASRQAQGGIREKDTEIRHRTDEMSKLEHEIDLLRVQITDKERRIAELKEESRDVMHSKEDLRREYELGHFSANTELSHAHDKGLQLQRFRQEKMRKEHELEGRRRELADIKKDLMFKEQEVAQLQSDLRRG